VYVTRRVTVTYMYSVVRNYCVRQYYKTMSLCSVGLSVFTRGKPLGSFADLDVFKIIPGLEKLGPEYSSRGISR